MKKKFFKNFSIILFLSCCLSISSNVAMDASPSSDSEVSSGGAPSPQNAASSSGSPSDAASLSPSGSSGASRDSSPGSFDSVKIDRRYIELHSQLKEQLETLPEKNEMLKILQAQQNGSSVLMFATLQSRLRSVDMQQEQREAISAVITELAGLKAPSQCPKRSGGRLRASVGSSENLPVANGREVPLAEALMTRRRFSRSSGYASPAKPITQSVDSQ